MVFKHCFTCSSVCCRKDENLPFVAGAPEDIERHRHVGSSMDRCMQPHSPSSPSSILLSPAIPPEAPIYTCLSLQSIWHLDFTTYHTLHYNLHHTAHSVSSLFSFGIDKRGARVTLQLYSTRTSEHYTINTPPTARYRPGPTAHLLPLRIARYSITQNKPSFTTNQFILTA